MRLIAKTAAQLRQAYERLSQERIIAVDTETTGLDPYAVVIHSVQLATEDGSFSVLVPRLPLAHQAQAAGRGNAPNIGPLIQVLNSPKILKLAQNATFDVKMLLHHYPGFKPVRWFDTMIAERLLTAGLYKRTSLADITERYLGRKRDKEIRTTFYDGTWDGFTWTEDLIDYALQDVEDLGKIAKQQIAKLKNERLVPVAQLENSLIRVWSKMELRGILYDREGGELFAQDMRAKADELEVELQQLLEPFWKQVWMPKYDEEAKAWVEWDTEWQRIKSETSKRKGLTIQQLNSQKLLRAQHLALRPSKPQWLAGGGINLGSPTQLLPTLRATGLSIENTKKETLEELAGANEQIDLLLEWRLHDKLAGTFGTPLLASINAVTCRIHPSFNPLVATGRCSCYNPNLQQVPQKTDQGKRLRKLFVAPKGRKLVVADYSGIEMVIIAVLSQDEVLLDAIQRNLDLHSNTISYALSGPSLDREYLYNALVAVKEGHGADKDFTAVKAARARMEEIADIPLLTKRGWTEKELTAWVKNLRDIFKTVSYGTAYGLSKYGLARRLHFSLDAADAVIGLFFKTYARTGAYLKESGRLGLERLYSLTVLGRKRYFRMPYPVTRERVEQRAQEMLKQLVKSGSALPFYELLPVARKELQKEYNGKLSSIERQAGNAPIQGTSADATKRAMLYIEEEIERRNWPLEDGLLLPVHDELIGEADDSRAEELRDIMETQMVRAVMELLGPLAPGLNIEVKPGIVEHWTH